MFKTGTRFFARGSVQLKLCQHNRNVQRTVRSANHCSSISLNRHFSHSTDLNSTPYISSKSDLKTEYDAVIVGAGHNGLVAAGYLQKAGMSVCLLERRHIIGGAAVTEELFPGFKFSRASYVLSLLRPQIFEDLELKQHGLKVYLRNPNSYTPLRQPMGLNGTAKSLLISRDEEANKREIAKFSKKDAENFGPYEEWLNRIVGALEPLLDSAPIDMNSWTEGSLRDKFRDLKAAKTLSQAARKLGGDTSTFLELLTAPAEKVLNQWFESEPLKATLATDATIGAMTSPKLPGSGYVLLHHVMGELEGIKGAWGYVEGGMGGVSNALAKSAHKHGASIFTDVQVDRIVTDSNNRAYGVALADGSEIKAKVVLSNATPQVTFIDLIEKGALPSEYMSFIQNIDYTSPVTKINVAVNRLPNFLADPTDGTPGPQHRGTIHLNCEDSELIHDAYVDCQQGIPSKMPMIEMTIPSSLDPTVAPEGCHVVQLFTQYTPYYLKGGREWTDADREDYANTIFNTIEEYAPGFKESVIGKDVLTPCDIERVFGLTGGNIFHGAMSLDQLYFSRPQHRTPLSGLYLCGSGTHPGGGVMGSPGKLAAEAVLKDLGRK